MFNQYLAGNKVYRGGSNVATYGTVDPMGYIERELRRRAQMTSPNYERSGLAAAALRRRGNPRAIGGNQQLLTYPTGAMGYQPPRVGFPAPPTERPSNPAPNQQINAGRAAGGIISLLARAAQRRLGQQPGRAIQPPMNTSPRAIRQRIHNAAYAPTRAQRATQVEVIPPRNPFRRLERRVF